MDTKQEQIGTAIKNVVNSLATLFETLRTDKMEKEQIASDAQKHYVTLTEATKLMHCCAITARKRANLGLISTKRIGKNVLYEVESIQNYLEHYPN